MVALTPKNENTCKNLGKTHTSTNRKEKKHTTKIKFDMSGVVTFRV